MSPSPRDRSTTRAEPQRVAGRTGAGARGPADPRRTAALAAAAGLCGAVLVALAAPIGVVRPEAGSAVLAATVVAVFCAAAAPVAALIVVRRAPAVAGALTAGAGAVALGLLVLDLQLWARPVDANRLELFRPLTAAHLTAGPGASAMLAGHALGVLGGLLGLLTVARASHDDGYGHSDYPDHEGASVGRRVGAGLSAVIAVAALAFAVASLAEPLRSSDPVLLVHPLLGAPPATAIGTAFVAVAVVVVVAGSLVSIEPGVAAGALVGAGTAALGLSGVQLAAGVAAGDGVGFAPGAAVASAAAAVLVLAGASVPAVAAARSRRGIAALTKGVGVESSVSAGRRSGAPSKAKALAAAEAAARARVNRWHRRAGLAGIAAGLLAVVGALLPVLAVPDGFPQPQILATRVVLVAAAVLAVASVWLFLSEFAGLVRPAVGVLWAALVAAVAGVLQSVVVASDLPGVGPGPGAWVLGPAAVAAAAAGLLAWCAGSAEREGIDTSVDVPPRRAVLVIGVPAAAVSVVALALPLYRGAGYGPDSVVHWPWGWDMWGRALLAVVVAVAVWVAAKARPARAAAGLSGAAGAMGVYLIGWPLTSGRVIDPVMGPGAVAAILGVVLLTVTAVVAVRHDRR
ncbi:hypothetical protein [Rhodococcus sp. NPDC127528]|uniref:hypothetical protein n=1 Tax=unclassified Rhodococcus (in: high G+C Gram-positive bacteria) TaxID=192944 RepID=UPI00363A9AA0